MVRREPALSRFRERRVCRGPRAMPRSARASLELSAGPGAVLAEQLGQCPGDLVSAVDVGGGAGPAGEQGVGPPAEEVAEPIADGLGVVAEVAGDAGRRPAGIGEEDHLDAVAGRGREVGSPQGVESGACCVVEVDADHAEL